MNRIILSKEDLDELIELNRKAQSTPVVAMSLADGLAGEDWSAQAWDRVRGKWQELGKKYGFEPGQVTGIDAKTGALIL